MCFAKGIGTLGFLNLRRAGTRGFIKTDVKGLLLVQGKDLFCHNERNIDFCQRTDTFARVMWDFDIGTGTFPRGKGTFAKGTMTFTRVFARVIGMFARRNGTLLVGKGLCLKDKDLY